MGRTLANHTGGARLLHADDGINHAFLWDKLTVLVTKDKDGLWFAHCVEIDYAACGESEKEVKKNFGAGLMATCVEHVVRNGNLNKMLQCSPVAALQNLGEAKKKKFSQISVAKIKTSKRKVDIQTVEAPQIPLMPLPFERLELEFARAA